MPHKIHALGDTAYFQFASNNTSGSGADGAAPVFDVRLCGAAAGAIPTLSGNATLLTHANYPDGSHEVAVVATAGNGFAADSEYTVFCALAVDGENPTGAVGSFKLVAAGSPLESTVEAAAAVWDYATALCVTVGSIGAMIVNYLGSLVALTPVADGEDNIREDFDQLPFRRDIEILQGRTWEESFKVRICLHGGDAELIDFTEATSGTLRFKASDGTITAEIALHELAIAGNITARLTIAQTTALEAGRQRWEMYFKFPVASTQFPDGEEFSLFSGWAVVKASIPAV